MSFYAITGGMFPIFPLNLESNSGHSVEKEEKIDKYYKHIYSMINDCDNRDNLKKDDYLHIISKSLDNKSIDKHLLDKYIFDHIHFPVPNFAKIYAKRLVHMEERLEKISETNEKVIKKLKDQSEKYKDEKIINGISDNAKLNVSIHSIKFEENKVYDDVFVNMSLDKQNSKTNKQDSSYCWPGFYDFQVTTFETIFTIEVYSNETLIGKTEINLENFKSGNHYENKSEIKEIIDTSSKKVGTINMEVLFINSHCIYSKEHIQKYLSDNEEHSKLKNDYDELSRIVAKKA